jgi:hypothetical protein
MDNAQDIPSYIYFGNRVKITWDANIPNVNCLAIITKINNNGPFLYSGAQVECLITVRYLSPLTDITSAVPIECIEQIVTN